MSPNTRRMRRLMVCGLSTGVVVRGLSAFRPGQRADIEHELLLILSIFMTSILVIGFYEKLLSFPAIHGGSRTKRAVEQCSALADGIALTQAILFMLGFRLRFSLIHAIVFVGGECVAARYAINDGADRAKARNAALGVGGGVLAIGVAIWLAWVQPL